MTGPGVSIGRHPSNDLCISETSVSRHHCAIRVERGPVCRRGRREHQRDIASTAFSVEECELKSGDQIRVGDNLFCFVTGEEEDQSFAQLASLGGVRLGGASPRFASIASQVAKLQPQLFIPPAGTLRARREIEVLLRIGEMLECVQDMECLKLRLLELIAEAIPARNGAIVLNATGWTSASSVFGWERDMGASAAPQVSSVDSRPGVARRRRGAQQ